MKNVRIKGGIDPWIVMREEGDNIVISLGSVQIKLHKSCCVEAHEGIFTIKETSKVYALESLAKQLSEKVSAHINEVSRLSEELSRLRRQISNCKLEIAALELKKANV